MTPEEEPLTVKAVALSKWIVMFSATVALVTSIWLIEVPEPLVLTPVAEPVLRA